MTCSFESSNSFTFVAGISDHEQRLRTRKDILNLKRTPTMFARLDSQESILSTKDVGLLLLGAAVTLVIILLLGVGCLWNR